MTMNRLDHMNEDTFKFHEKKTPVSRSWSVTSKRGGILQSKCSCETLSQTKPITTQETKDPVQNSVRCNICYVIQELKNLNGLPDMLFHDSLIRLEHRPTGVAIEFNPIDALKEVKETQDPLQVAVADGWQSARADFPFANRILKPYDWTYTTSYKGTLREGSKIPKDDVNTNSNATSDNSLISPNILKFNIEETLEEIDINKLKERDEITFYEDITLYEDELADHGVSKYSVKIRVMPSCMFLLARFYLRIDGVLVRINDTRIYHDFRKNYLIREYTNREARIKALEVPLSTILDPTLLMSHLPVIHKSLEKLYLPNV